MIDEVFARLGIRTTVKLNNRKVLAGIAELIGEPDKIIDITVAIDKIDKIGLDNVKAELAERGLSQEAIDTITPVITLSGTNEERLTRLKELLSESETGQKGVEELQEVINGTKQLGLRAELELDVSLARGLNYYTGTIIEVKARDVEIGSITGGGRYDNLTGIFGLPDVSGVGISFGADRIYDVLNTLNLYPANITGAAKVMFTNFGTVEAAKSLEIIKQLRANGISAEIYPDPAKMKKQMGRADALGISFVAIIGETEIAENKVTLKNMTTGEQQSLSVEELIKILA